MRSTTLLFTAAVCTALISTGFAQLRAVGGCQGSADGTQISVRPPSALNLGLRTGAPYSAIRSGQSVTTLPDGTHLTRRERARTAIWRDSAGRVRTEERPTPGERHNMRCTDAVVEIDDPVAGYVYLLDPANQVAYRVPFAPPPAARVRPAAPQPASTATGKAPGGPVITTEALGEKTVSGVTVRGTRTTATYPAGSELGNDRPVAQTTESWVSDQLNLQVYSQNTSYDQTVSTTTLEDLSVAEPDPSLFQVPPGYEVVDQSGQFTITIPGRN